MDEIRIENLEIYAGHGVFAEENRNGQPFFVNATLYTDTRAAGQKDDLTLSTHYGEVSHLIHKCAFFHPLRILTETLSNGSPIGALGFLISNERDFTNGNCSSTCSPTHAKPS